MVCPPSLANDTVLLTMFNESFVSAPSSSASFTGLATLRARWSDARNLTIALDSKQLVIANFEAQLEAKLVSFGFSKLGLGVNEDESLGVASLIESFNRARDSLQRSQDAFYHDLKQMGCVARVPRLDYEILKPLPRTSLSKEIQSLVERRDSSRKLILDVALVLDRIFAELLDGLTEKSLTGLIIELVKRLEQPLVEVHYPPQPVNEIQPDSNSTKSSNPDMRGAVDADTLRAPLTPGEKCMLGVDQYLLDTERIITELQAHVVKLKSAQMHLAQRDDVRVSEENIAQLCLKAKAELADDLLGDHIKGLRQLINDTLDRSFISREMDLFERHRKAQDILQRTQKTFADHENADSEINDVKHSLFKLNRAIPRDTIAIEKATRRLAELEQCGRFLISQMHKHEKAMQLLACSCQQPTASDIIDGHIAAWCDFPELYYAVSRAWSTPIYAVSDEVRSLIDEAGLAYAGVLEDFELKELPKRMKELLPRNSLKVLGAVHRDYIGPLEDTIEIHPEESPLRVLKIYPVRQDSPEDFKQLRRALLLPRKITSPYVLPCEGVM